MTKFDNVLKILKYNASCYNASVVLGTKGIFGATYEEAVKSQILLDEFKAAIAILEEKNTE